METPNQSINSPSRQSTARSLLPDKHTKNAEKQKRYREKRHQNETIEEQLECRSRYAEKQRKYVASLAQCKTNDELAARKRKNAACQRNYIKAKKQFLSKENEFIARKGLDSFNEYAVSCHNVGKMDYLCTECRALMFKDEQSGRAINDKSKAKFTLCCSHGAVKTPPVKEPPELLKRLLTGSTPRDREFRKKYQSIQFKFSICFNESDWKGTQI